MGRKGKICVPKLLDGLMGHLPLESASPGFCPLPSVMQSGVLLIVERDLFLDTRVRHIWGGIPAILTCFPSWEARFPDLEALLERDSSAQRHPGSHQYSLCLDVISYDHDPGQTTPLSLRWSRLLPTT